MNQHPISPRQQKKCSRKIFGYLSSSVYRLLRLSLQLAWVPMVFFCQSTHSKASSAAATMVQISLSGSNSILCTQKVVEVEGPRPLDHSEDSHTRLNTAHSPHTHTNTTWITSYLNPLVVMFSIQKFILLLQFSTTGACSYTSYIITALSMSCAPSFVKGTMCLSTAHHLSAPKCPERSTCRNSVMVLPLKCYFTAITTSGHWSFLTQRQVVHSPVLKRAWDQG